MDKITVNKRRALLKAMAFSPLLGFTGCHLVGDQKKVPPLNTFKNLFAFEKYSCSGLDPEACDFLNGGADDLLTVKMNHEAYEQIKLVSHQLVDVSHIDTSLQLFGVELKSPILLAPVGLNQLFHEEGELATARGARASEKMMIASHMTSYSFEEISKAYGSPIWFQLYMSDDQGYNLEMISRAERAGASAIFLTIDVPTGGNREGHEGYLTRIAQAGDLYFGNFSNGLKSTVLPTLTWKDVLWVREHTQVNLVVKGVVSAHDAKLALDAGVNGIVVSNHGGRQLESNRGTIESLPEIREAVENKVPLLIDGGIRRGTDIIKAIALGASAVAIGRPFVWGLTLFGEPGVQRVLDILHAELVRDMMLLGTPSLTQINEGHIRMS